MELNKTPSGQRVHIGLFGRRNAGKSSLLNALAGQNLAIVSDIKGTTTDPVQKVMELLPLGPVVLIDTPGLDDESQLGALRVEKSYDMLRKTDVALLVVAGNNPLADEEVGLLEKWQKNKIPAIIVRNKADELSERTDESEQTLYVSSKTGENIHQLKEKIAACGSKVAPDYPIIKDLIAPSDIVILVMPQDAAAPKGRLILPQQQTIREIIDAHAMALVVQPEELAETIASLRKPPKMVVTDSQAFAEVAKIVPPELTLTSFSILFARHKGILERSVAGIAAIEKLPAGAPILISEGCTHHRQCEDIGTVKIPNLLKKYTGKDFTLHFTSGGEFPRDLAPYALVIHCGACVLNPQEVKSRMAMAAAQGIPMTNYGLALAYMNGILKRTLAPFPNLQKMLQDQ